MAEDIRTDPRATLRISTRARVGLGRSGDAPLLRDVLAFQFAHARARDAVHAAFDVDALIAAAAPHPCVVVNSRASDRNIYLRRPDLGRRLDPACSELPPAGDWDAVFLAVDGLSAPAVVQQAPLLLRACLDRLPNWRIAPMIVVRQGRVAIGDEIGEALGAAMSAVMIGERPGLSVAESLGVYLTHAPRAGRADSERNCISNIHHQGGLPVAVAADKLVWLMIEARRRKLTGVGLKDAAPTAALGAGFDPHDREALVDDRDRADRSS